MSLRVTWIDDAGASRGFSIRRASDDLLYDPADGTFKVSPAAPVMALAAGSGDFAGTYSATLADTPTADWLEGDYLVLVHDTATANAVVGAMGVVMHAADAGQSDDSTVIPSGAGVAPPSAAEVAAATVAALLDNASVAGRALRAILRDMWVAAVGDITEPADNSASTITEPGTGVVAITTTNTKTTRRTTLH